MTRYLAHIDDKEISIARPCEGPASIFLYVESSQGPVGTLSGWFYNEHHVALILMGFSITNSPAKLYLTGDRAKTKEVLRILTKWDFHARIVEKGIPANLLKFGEHVYRETTL